MSTTPARILVFILAIAGGVWAVLESGASPTAGKARDIRPEEIGLGTEIVSPVRVARVTTSMSPRGELHPGQRAEPRPVMYATARIIVDSLPGGILVPRDAVLSQSNRSTVFLVPGERSHWVYVHVGEESESTSVIICGVAPGDAVIVDGHFALGDNARIRIETEGRDE